MAITPKSGRNFVLGAGKVYVAPYNAATGKYEGERDLGNTPGGTITVESEVLEHWDADGATAQKVASVVTTITRRGTLSVDDIDDDNIALFVGGDAGETAQSGTTVTDESVGEGEALAGNRHYQLGMSATNPTGVREISSVSIKSDAGATTHVEGTDYEIDLTLGRIKVIEGGGLDGEASVTATYTRAAKSIPKVESADQASVKCRLRFIADNRNGTNRDIVANYVDLKPSGDWNFKSTDTFQSLGFEFEILEPPGGAPALIINGRAV